MSIFSVLASLVDSLPVYVSVIHLLGLFVSIFGSAVISFCFHLRFHISLWIVFTLILSYRLLFSFIGLFSVLTNTLMFSFTFKYAYSSVIRVCKRRPIFVLCLLICCERHFLVRVVFYVAILLCNYLMYYTVNELKFCWSWYLFFLWIVINNNNYYLACWFPVNSYLSIVIPEISFRFLYIFFLNMKKITNSATIIRWNQS